MSRIQLAILEAKEWPSDATACEMRAKEIDELRRAISQAETDEKNRSKRKRILKKLEEFAHDLDRYGYDVQFVVMSHSTRPKTISFATPRMKAMYNDPASKEIREKYFVKQEHLQDIKEDADEPEKL